MENQVYICDLRDLSEEESLIRDGKITVELSADDSKCHIEEFSKANYALIRLVNDDRENMDYFYEIKKVLITSPENGLEQAIFHLIEEERFPARIREEGELRNLVTAGVYGYDVKMKTFSKSELEQLQSDWVKKK